MTGGLDLESLVDIVIEDDRWQGVDLETLAERAVHAALQALDLPRTGLTLCVMGCDDAEIAELNGSFRAKSSPTNVLSFPSWDLAAEAEGAAPVPPPVGTSDDPEMLGDIALAWETCTAEAEEAGKPFTDHVTHLIVHGFLHLLGYDHIREGDARLMETLEVRILASLGLSDPYE